MHLFCACVSVCAGVRVPLPHTHTISRELVLGETSRHHLLQMLEQSVCLVLFQQCQIILHGTNYVPQKDILKTKFSKLENRIVAEYLFNSANGPCTGLIMKRCVDVLPCLLNHLVV